MSDEGNPHIFPLLQIILDNRSDLRVGLLTAMKLARTRLSSGDFEYWCEQVLQAIQENAPTEKGIVAKALDEHGITWDCGPAEKDPEKEFVCGLKDSDRKVFQYPAKP